LGTTRTPPQIGEGEDAAAGSQERLGGPAEGNQGVGAHIHGQGKPFPRDIAKVAAQLFFFDESQAVNQDIDLTPFLGYCLKQLVNLLVALHVAREEKIRLQGLGELLDFGLEAIPLVRQIGNPQRRPRFVQLLGNAPGDGALVGNAGYQGFFSGQV
jgi:hypothetical protein